MREIQSISNSLVEAALSYPCVATVTSLSGCLSSAALPHFIHIIRDDENRCTVHICTSNAFYWIGVMRKAIFFEDKDFREKQRVNLRATKLLKNPAEDSRNCVEVALVFS